jgi:hypothetical protein
MRGGPLLEPVLNALRDIHQFKPEEPDYVHSEARIEEEIGLVGDVLEYHRGDHEDHTVHEKHEATHF